MNLRIVGQAVLPQAPEQFEPALTQTAQGRGVAHSFFAFFGIVSLGPGRPMSAAIGPQMHGVSQEEITSPTDVHPVDLTALKADGTDSRVATQGIGVSKDLPVGTQLTQQTRRQLFARPGQRAENVMVRMVMERFTDAAAISFELLFQSLQHANEAYGQKTFGRHHRRASGQGISRSENVHALGAGLWSPQPVSVKKLFPTSFSGLLQNGGGGEFDD